MDLYTTTKEPSAPYAPSERVDSYIATLEKMSSVHKCQTRVSSV